jgi:uncharacterized protein
LKINVRNIPEDGLKIHFEKEEDWHRRVLGPEQGSEKGMDFSLKPTTIDGLATRVGDTVTLGLKVQTSIDIQCGRCLEPLIIPVNSEFKYTLTPAPEEAESTEIEVSLDEVNVGYYQEDEMDLEPIVLEQIVLQIPIKPLCREECKGLCPQCGADLNVETCDCRTNAGDLRLAVLKNFKVKKKE